MRFFGKRHDRHCVAMGVRDIQSLFIFADGDAFRTGAYQRVLC